MNQTQQQLIAFNIRLEIDKYGAIREWYQNGMYHGLHDLPAVQWTDTGTCQWRLHGVLHRAGGRPAQLIYHDGVITRASYYLRGYEVDQAESAAYEDEA